MTNVTPEQFAKEMESYRKRTIPKIIAASHGALVFEIWTKILERTPVLTGRARRNWNVSFNRPDPEITDDVAGVSKTGEPLLSHERERARRVLKNIEYAKLGSVVYISNHLPYIWFLEHGSSQKAPNGIVEGAIQGGLEALNSKGVKLDLDSL